MLQSTAINMLRLQKAATQLQCSACGVVADGACDCGAPCVPVSVRAAEAIAKSPEKSNRAIAADLGVGVESVRTTRNKLGDQQGSPANHVGKDGKSKVGVEDRCNNARTADPPRQTWCGMQDVLVCRPQDDFSPSPCRVKR
jgi:hypothetical protein